MVVRNDFDTVCSITQRRIKYISIVLHYIETDYKNMTKKRNITGLTHKAP